MSASSGPIQPDMDLAQAERYAGVYSRIHSSSTVRAVFSILMDEYDRRGAALAAARAKCEEVARRGFDSMGLREVEAVLAAAPTYRRAGPRRTGEIVESGADLATVERLIQDAPADYPGLTLMRRHADELRAQALAAAPETSAPGRMEDRWALDDIAELAGFHRDAHPAEVVRAVRAALAAAATPAPPVDAPFVATSSGTFRPGDRIEWTPEPGMWEPGEVRSVDGGTIVVQLDGGDFAHRAEATDLRHQDEPSSAAPPVDVAAPLAVLSALIGDMACGLEVGGNTDAELADYLIRLRAIARALTGEATP